jgi:DNA-nicking Smr family endonuclease
VIKKTNRPFEDQHLFRQEVGDVVPLKTAATTDSKAPRSPTLPRKPDTPISEFNHLTSPAVDEQFHINSEEGSTHRKNGVQKRLMQKLKRGQFKVFAQIDLHNMTTKSAYTALLEFIARSSGETLQCVRIIHGKGLRSEHGPRLKLMTRQLLRDQARVLAFTACKPNDGGDGATDVLLKSS